MIDEAVAAFERIFGRRPTACGVAPGRVEILGNHTDYNGGCVLTAAIDRSVAVAGRACAGEEARVHSLFMDSAASFSVRRPARDPDVAWVDYVKGVVTVLRQTGPDLPAFEAVIAADLPVASGLSSSAALEAATARFIGALTPLEVDPCELAVLLQRAENEFVGVRCGILDQFSSIHGLAGHAIFLDCATLEHERLSMGPDPPAIVLCDSGVPRSLAAGLYNARRQECEQTARLLGELLGRPVHHLCEVTADEFREVASRLPQDPQRRGRHVIEENQRVRQARDALRAGRIADLGRLMHASHESSRVNFQNSTDELDLLCQIAAQQPGCIGSRLCGAGWGGCTVNLVAPPAVGDFGAAIASGFEPATGRPPIIHVCQAADAARTIPL